MKRVLLALLLFAMIAPAQAAEEKIKIGLAMIAAGAPVFIAQDRGYFAEAGVPAEIVRFDNAIAIAAAILSGDIDFGTTGISAGLYNLAGQGTIRIIGSLARDVPGFQQFAVVVSNPAAAAGLKTYRDLPGHSVAIVAAGATSHYVVGLLAEKYGFDIKTLRLQPLQTPANIVSAVTGAQSDVGVLPATQVMAAVERRDVTFMGFSGDEVRWQSGVVFTSTRMANERRSTVEHFLAAYRRGTKAYHEAFIGADGKRADGPGAAEIMPIIAKYTGEPPERLKLALPYIDGDARLDVKDLLHQIVWFKGQGMMKGEVDGEALLDKRYVVPLPGQ